jgi:Dolichyl-phosphate-mannose-protein mannosyltransferase
MKANKIKSSRARSLFVMAAMLIGIYIAIAWLQKNFAFPNYDYTRTNGLSLAWISSPEFQSYIWKVLLLVPAVILCSVALTRMGFHFALPEHINDKIIICSILVVALIILIFSTQFLFHETEVTDDENTYDFQAQTILAGRIINPPPPVINSFHNVFIINNGSSWVGKYTLGHVLVIAFGMLLGNRYIGIIGISILTLFLIYCIVKELYGDKKLALLTLCLAAVSPFFYLMSSSRLSHTTTAFFLALFMYLFLRVRRIENIGLKLLLSAAAGLSVGYALNTRTLTAIGFALPFVVVVVRDALKYPKKNLVSYYMMGIGFLVMVALMFWYNIRVTGNPMQFPFHYYNSLEEIGFGTYGHTPLLGIKNLVVNLFRLNVSLFGFPLSLLFAFFLLFTQKDNRDNFLFSIFGSFILFYFFYYSPGVSDLGPVYYYEMIIPLLILSARGIFATIEFLSKYSAEGKTVVSLFLFLSFLGAWGTYIPEKITHIARLTNQIREPYEFVEASNIHHAIVIIRQLPNKGWVFSYRNPSPKFTDDVVFCGYTDSSSNRAVVNYFSNRTPYILQYDKNNTFYEILQLDRNTLQFLSIQKE